MEKDSTALSGTPGNTTDSGLSSQFLTFTIGEEEYGVDIMMVREVKGWTETTRLPGSPEYLRGVLNLRGIIIPIFDLRCRFGQGLTDAGSKNVIIIIAVGERTIGILVDTVSDILSVNSGDVKPAPESESEEDQRFISGLIAVEGRMVVLLDIQHLFENHISEQSVITDAALAAAHQPHNNQSTSFA